jgi:flagellar biosynthetic protein FliR
MRDDTALVGLAVGFLLVLTRIGAFFAFIPIPGSKAFVETPKVVLTIIVALMLFRFWPSAPDGVRWSMSSLVVAMGSEMLLGLAIGTGLALVIEAMQMAAQFVALQAGFSYAATIDPNSDVDAGILLILAQLLTSLIIFGVGLDRQILGALASSFERIPPGSYHLTPFAAMGILTIGGQMLQIALRLSLPVISVLLIAEFALVLLGKIEQHLQLSHMLFSLKTLAALAILATVISSSARLIEQWLASGWRAVSSAAGL